MMNAFKLFSDICQALALEKPWVGTCLSRYPQHETWADDIYAELMSIDSGWDRKELIPNLDGLKTACIKFCEAVNKQ